MTFTNLVNRSLMNFTSLLVPLGLCVTLTSYVTAQVPNPTNEQSVLNQQQQTGRGSDDFAPPNTTPQKQRRTQNGMTGVAPRTPGQIHNFLTPLNEADYEQYLRTDEQKDVRETSSRLELIVENYPNGAPRVRRYVTQDEEGNYYNQGTWQLLGKQQEVTAEGEFDQGRMTGSWKRLHNKTEGGLFATEPFKNFEGPYRSYAEFQNGKLDGVWKITDRYDQVIFEMPYTEGKRNGTATWYHTNSEKMREVTFKDGVLDGMLFEWNERQDVIRQEEYYEGRKVVRETQFYEANKPQSQNFYRDVILEVAGDDDWWNASPANYVAKGQRFQHGPTGTWYKNGQPQMRGQFENGLREGIFVGWHSNGQKDVVGRFEKDQRVGKWTWWHPNGFKRVEGQFDAGIQVGEWTWWNENGTILKRRDMGTQRTFGETSHQQEENQPSDSIIDTGNQREEIQSQELPEKNNAPEQELIIPFEENSPKSNSSESTDKDQSQVDPDSKTNPSGLERQNDDAEEILPLPEDLQNPADDLSSPTFKSTEPVSDPFGDQNSSR